MQLQLMTEPVNYMLQTLLFHLILKVLEVIVTKVKAVIGEVLHECCLQEELGTKLTNY